MVEIVKGRYGYRAEDGTVQVAAKGKRLRLQEFEEQRLVSIGVAVSVKDAEEPAEAVVEARTEPAAEEVKTAKKPKTRKGKK